MTTTENTFNTTETLETTEERLYTAEELLNEDTNEEIEETIGHLDSEELEVLEAIIELKISWKWDTEKKQYFYTIEDLQDAVDLIDNVTHFKDWDSYYDYCDEMLDFTGSNEMIERYFDYETYHRDCGFDVSEASNGVILGDW